MPRSWLGRGSRERRQLASAAVLGLLPPDESELGWSELKERAEKEGLSSATLRAHLRKFLSLGLVRRRMDPSTYPPRVYYSRRGSLLFPQRFDEQARLSAELDLVGEIVDKGLFKPGTGGFYEEAVNVNLLFMKAALPVILYVSMGGKGPYEFGPGELGKPGAIEAYLDRVHVDVHDLADELLDVVLRPWIHRLLDVLEIFSSTNKDVLEEAAEPILEEAVQALKRYDALLEPYRAR